MGSLFGAPKAAAPPPPPPTPEMPADEDAQALAAKQRARADAETRSRRGRRGTLLSRSTSSRNTVSQGTDSYSKGSLG